MTNQSLKTKAANGLFWSAIDKIAVQAGQFIIGVILARLLMPEDFGLIGMLSVFIAISNSFINSGMGSGLIQKKDRSDVDFSTVFVFNFIVSVFFYFILYISAPLISDFYSSPKLVDITRVLSLNIIITSLAIVQRTKLTINIDFKTHAVVNIISVIAGGLSALLLALSGWGVWALVAQNIVGSLAAVISIWYLSKWKPSIRFSKDSFNKLFGFGSKILISSIYSQTLNNINAIAIGRVYSSSELGYYSRAKTFSDTSSGVVSSVLDQVTFPILASLQNEQDRMVTVFRRIIKMISFFIFPIMVLISLLADPLIRILLGEKWLPVIVLLQWLSFARVLYPLHAVNMNILKAIGRSDLFLKVDLFQFPKTLVIMIITIPLGVKAIVIGSVISSVIGFFINTYLPGKLFGYGALSQIKDMIPVFVATAVMSFVVFTVNYMTDNSYIQLFLGAGIGIITYYLMSCILKIEEVNEIRNIIVKIINRK